MARKCEDCHRGTAVWTIPAKDGNAARYVCRRCFEVAGGQTELLESFGPEVRGEGDDDAK